MPEFAERSAARRGAATRDAIDRAAIELFAGRGYHATSMRALASAAQVQPAAIYHWYPNKEAILVHLQDQFMEQLTARVLAAIEPQDHPALRLAAVVREHVVFHGHHRLEAFVTDSEIRALTDDARAALAILLQCTGVALWFDPAGPLRLEQVAELHIELVLGALGASTELIGEAVEGVARRAVEAA